MSNIEELDIDAIEKRTNAATPGSWAFELEGKYATVWMLPDHGSLVLAKNAEFIAHARSDIPALIAEVRRLRAELDQVMGLVENINWVEDSLRDRGVVLTGRAAHWCREWDGLTMDETCPEWPCGCARVQNFESTEDG